MGYLNAKKDILINETFDCCRFIYNKFLNVFNESGYISKYDKNNNILKQEFLLLKEVDKFTVINSICNLDNYIKLPKL